MLTIYDYLMIAFHFGFIASLGFIFKKFNSGSSDYFAGGFKMTWWLLGSSVFVASFSAWTFTGAAHVSYKFGIVILVVFWGNAFSYLIQALSLASWFRQLRVVTAMEAVRDRFGKQLEQFYTWMQILQAFIANAVTLLSVSLLMSVVFDAPIVATIILAGVVVVTLSLVGGAWAVAASDFVQSILIISVALTTSLFCIMKLGGLDEFWNQIPEENKNFLLDSSVKYDQWWVLAMIIGMLYMNNNLSMTAKYIAAKDTTAAKGAAWVACAGYLFIAPIFFIPSMSAHTLIPDLAALYPDHANPSELSYIAVCLALLPKGMIGLLAAGLFAATMSSMDTGLNKVAGFFTINFYQPILRKGNATDDELFKVGHFATLFIGATAIVSAILLSMTDVPLFEVFQKCNSYMIIPMGVPMFLGLFVRRTPKWASLVTIIIGVMVSFFIYNDLGLDWVAATMQGLFGEGIYEYTLGHQFAAINLINIPVLTLVFLLSGVFFPTKDQAYIQSTDEFFKRMHTPIDFEKEVGGDSSHKQARLIGRLLLVYGFSVSIGVFIPNEGNTRYAFLFCGGMMLAIGGILEFVSRRKAVIEPDDRSNLDDSTPQSELTS